MAESLRLHLEQMAAAWKGHIPTEFLLRYGCDYQIGPQTYAGPRGEPKGCYQNATLLAYKNEALTYVEGKVGLGGLPIDHAWCVDAHGTVIDPTIAPDDDGSFARISGYFGVPFLTTYVRKATVTNMVYGLLDYFYAGKTAPKLYELGLIAGQAWLLDHNGPVRKPRKPRKK